jgi:hypothetical protein
LSGAAPRATPALAAAAEGCSPRGKLDPIYCDDNGDGIADPPKDPAKLLNPDSLVFGPAPPAPAALPEPAAQSLSYDAVPAPGGAPPAPQPHPSTRVVTASSWHRS